MEKKSILENISSMYIFNIIFSFVNYPNFKLKFFIHSTKFQSKLDLSIIDYQSNFHQNRDWDFFLSIAEDDIQKILDSYQINLECLKTILYNYYENKKYKKSIDILSNLFNILSSDVKFAEFFSVCIDINKISNSNLKNELISKLNNMKNIALSIELSNDNDITNLKNLKLKYNQITNLYVELKNGKKKKNNSFVFLIKFFSFDEIKNNLTELNCNYELKNIPPNINIFYELYNFKSLKNLTLSSLEFIDNYTIKLKNLDCLKIFLKLKI